jgi:sugar/nucleoside kinase (ribokinase family)
MKKFVFLAAFAFALVAGTVPTMVRPAVACAAVVRTIQPQSAVASEATRLNRPVEWHPTPRHPCRPA